MMQCGEFSILYCIYADISNYSLNYQKIYFDQKLQVELSDHLSMEMSPVIHDFHLS